MMRRNLGRFDKHIEQYYNLWKELLELYPHFDTLKIGKKYKTIGDAYIGLSNIVIENTKKQNPDISKEEMELLDEITHEIIIQGVGFLSEDIDLEDSNNVIWKGEDLESFINHHSVYCIEYTNLLADLYYAYGEKIIGDEIVVPYGELNRNSKITRNMIAVLCYFTQISMFMQLVVLAYENQQKIKEGEEIIVLPYEENLNLYDAIHVHIKDNILSLSRDGQRSEFELNNEDTKYVTDEYTTKYRHFIDSLYIKLCDASNEKEGLLILDSHREKSKKIESELIHTYESPYMMVDCTVEEVFNIITKNCNYKNEDFEGCRDIIHSHMLQHFKYIYKNFDKKI